MLNGLTRRVYRAVRALLRKPLREPKIVYGAQPGQLWDVRRGRWVPESESFKPQIGPSGGIDFALVGPVYTISDYPL